RAQYRWRHPSRGEGRRIHGVARKRAAINPAGKERSPGKPRGMTQEVIHDRARLENVVAELSARADYAPFRRGTFPPELGMGAKVGGRELWVGAETDSSFGHAKIDMLTPPEDESDVPLLSYCVRTLLHELLKLETASVFALCAVDWPLSNQVYGELGFKVTARLTDHVTRDEDFIGAQLWHRRLANTPTPRLPSFI